MSEKLKVIESLDSTTLDSSFRDLETMDRQGKLDFKLPIQRELKWSDAKTNNYKSLFIFSILLNKKIGTYECYIQDGVYHFLDGKQRHNTVFSFMRGEFALKYLPIYRDRITKKETDVNGLRFDQLPIELQEKITSCKPEVTIYNSPSDAQQAYIFKTTNNGMQLTNLEKARVEMKDQETIVNLAYHELFSLALTSKQIRNREGESIIKNIWGVFNVPNVSFLDKIFKPIIQDVVFSEEQKVEITNVLDRLLECYNILKKQAQKEPDKKVKAKKLRFLKKVFKKVHIPTMSKVILKSINDGISAQQLSEWVLHFFNTDKGSSISEEYNKASVGGSASAVAVKTRLFEVMKDYEKFINNVEITSESVSEPIETQTNEDTTQQSNEQEKAPETQQQQSEPQISFDEAQAKQNEQVYNTKRSHHKK